VDDYQNTPSIIAQEITSFRGGQRLAYGDLTGPEKRDYLFDAGIRATTYANEPAGSRPGRLPGGRSGPGSLSSHLRAHRGGEAEGTAIVDPGTAGSPEIAKMINHFAWQGKIFDAKNKTLANHIGPFGMKATLAEIHIGKSLIDKKDCVVLDYSKTSLVAKHIRDEIRQIAPKTYLVRSSGTQRSCSTSLSNSRVE